MDTSDASLRRHAILRRVIYLLVAMFVVVPFLPWCRFPMKIKPAKQVEALYDKIQSLPAGSPVLFSLDYDPTAKEELYPMTLALLRHCFSRNLHPIVMTHWVTNLGLCRELLDIAAKETQKVSGRDYVFLGFKPGGGNLLLNMGESLKGAFPKDFAGASTDRMPALAGIDSLRDIPLAVDIAAGATVEMWIAYGSDRFGFELGAGCTAVIAPDLYPFLQSGQLVGLVGGLRGAADYETLIGRPGAGVAGMPSQSVAHILIIALIIGANFHFLARRRSRSKER